MEGDHACPTHKKRCVEREEENYFFALSKYQNQIQVRPISSGVHPSSGWIERPDSIGVQSAGLIFSLHRHAKHVDMESCPDGCMPVQALIEEEGFVQPEARRNEMLGWVRAGLRDFSISRAAVAWGIPIPLDPSQTVYVWFDALLGYMSGASHFTPCAQIVVGEFSSLM